MTVTVFLAAVAVGLLVPLALGMASRAVLSTAGVVFLALVVAALLLAPTSATDCGRCSFGQDLLGFLVFAVLPGLLVGLLLAALARLVRPAGSRA